MTPDPAPIAHSRCSRSCQRVCGADNVVYLFVEVPGHSRYAKRSSRIETINARVRNEVEVERWEAVRAECEDKP